MTEQEKFEAYFKAEAPVELSDVAFEKAKNGDYRNTATFFAWCGWQAAVASTGAPELLSALKDILTAVMGIEGITRIPRIQDCIPRACRVIDKAEGLTT